MAEKRLSGCQVASEGLDWDAAARGMSSVYAPFQGVGVGVTVTCHLGNADGGLAS